MPGGQLVTAHPEAPLDLQLAAIVVAGFGEEQGAGKVGANARAGGAVNADRIVDVEAEFLAATIAVEQRRKDAVGQGGGKECRCCPSARG